MNCAFNEVAWQDYQYWQANDKKKLKKINDLIKDISRNGEAIGLGKPEPLKAEYSGYYSRRIDYKDRLIYKVKDNIIFIVSCRNHYLDK